jgi:hypothetical protein
MTAGEVTSRILKIYLVLMYLYWLQGLKAGIIT